MSTNVNFLPTICRMEYGEAEQLSAVFALVVKGLPYYNEAAVRSELNKYSPSMLCSSISHDPDSVLVAKERGEILGFCLSHYDDGLIWLAWFGVHPSHRRKGIGSALLQKLENTVGERHAHKIWCDSRTENEASELVLTNQGYRQLCTVRNHWYGQDFILWEKLPQ